MGTCYVINWIQVSNFTFLKKTLRFSKQMKEWKKTPKRNTRGAHRRGDWFNIQNTICNFDLLLPHDHTFWHILKELEMRFQTKQKIWLNYRSKFQCTKIAKYWISQWKINIDYFPYEYEIRNYWRRDTNFLLLYINL